MPTGLLIIAALVALVVTVGVLLAIWSIISLMAIVAFVVLLTFAVTGFAYYLAQDSRDRAAQRENLLYRFAPDSNGNYAAWFDPRTLESFMPEPGNPLNPAVQNVIVSNGQIMPIGPLSSNGTGFYVSNICSSLEELNPLPSNPH